jgi:hypothetical protein
MSKEFRFVHPASFVITPVDEFFVDIFNLCQGGLEGTSDLLKTSLLTSLLTCSKFAPNRIRRFAISLSIVSCSLFSSDVAISRHVSPGDGSRRSIKMKYGLSGRSSVRASLIYDESTQLK